MGHSLSCWMEWAVLSASCSMSLLRYFSIKLRSLVHTSVEECLVLDRVWARAASRCSIEKSVDHNIAQTCLIYFLYFKENCSWKKAPRRTTPGESEVRVIIVSYGSFGRCGRSRKCGSSVKYGRFGKNGKRRSKNLLGLFRAKPAYR